MSVASLDPSALLDHALEFATQNLTIEKILIQLGLDPGNITYDALFNRLLEVALANITFANVLALIGGIFLISTFVVRTIVPMRVLCIVSIVFFLGSAVLAGSVPRFFLYLLALPINVIRLVQIRNLVKKARTSAQGTMSLDWLRPFMVPRNYKKGDVLFRKGDAATEMFLTVTGKFLVSEIAIEIPAGRILGELGFLSPKNNRTQSVECIEDGEVLTIPYDKLLEIYFQNPEFGYFFLRLTSDRLLQNYARLQGIEEQNKAALASLAKSANLRDPNQAGDARIDQKKPVQPASSAGGEARRGGAPEDRRPEASVKTLSKDAAETIIEIIPREKGSLAAAESASPGLISSDAVAVRRRMRAFAIVERHAVYSALGGFIPVPIANVSAITAVNMRMVKALSKHYGVPFEPVRNHAVVIGLMGGIMPTGLATVATSTFVYLVPGANLIGLAVSSVTASAYARSVGRMLVDHLERGAAA